MRSIPILLAQIGTHENGLKQATAPDRAGEHSTKTESTLMRGRWPSPMTDLRANGPAH
jgi:hypothetical protein